MHMRKKLARISMFTVQGLWRFNTISKSELPSGFSSKSNLTFWSEIKIQETNTSWLCVPRNWSDEIQFACWIAAFANGGLLVEQQYFWIESIYSPLEVYLLNSCIYRHLVCLYSCHIITREAKEPEVSVHVPLLLLYLTILLLLNTFES